MCGRYTLRTPWQHLAEHFGLSIVRVSAFRFISPDYEHVLADRAATARNEALVETLETDVVIGKKQADLHAQMASNKIGAEATVRLLRGRTALIIARPHS